MSHTKIEYGGHSSSHGDIDIYICEECSDNSRLTVIEWPCPAMENKEN